MGRLFVISGSSGVGKGTIIKQLLNNNENIKLSISCTTRLKREGEVDGVNYFFIDKEEFQNNINNNKFIEWAEFSGNMYGTKRDYVEKCLSEGNDLILEIDTKGALNIKKIMNDAILIFILPPSFEELEARLRGRKTESEDAIQKRLAATKSEIENSKFYDYRIINDNIDDAVKALELIING